MSSSARYSAENIVAYHAGNAANVAPAATTSQTSLPSQTGPMVSSMVSRSASSRAHDRQQHPHAEVEPLQDEVAGPEDGDEARTRGSARLIVAPQKLTAATAGSSGVAERRVDAREPAHEHDVDDREAAIEDEEHAEADRRASSS